jgi:membrane protease YdiL (CAAX protease family)
MVAIAILYPIFLVIPQELIYRALFFERYGYLFSSQRQAIFINALLFSFGHLMYWHIVVWFMTFIGSFIFSYAYLRPNGFMQTIALHSIAGIAIFASGLGWLFYSGGNLAQ